NAVATTMAPIATHQPSLFIVRSEIVMFNAPSLADLSSALCQRCPARLRCKSGDCRFGQGNRIFK
ncbi:MAG: hypothetical protein WAU00_11420, partial [Caldilinea sp.]